MGKPIFHNIILDNKNIVIITIQIIGEIIEREREREREREMIHVVGIKIIYLSTTEKYLVKIGISQ